MDASTAPEIGDIFRSRRKERKLTLKQLADIAGISKSMLSHIERGEANPSFALLWRLTLALGMSLSELTPLRSPPDRSQPEFVSMADTPQVNSVDGGCRMRILSPRQLIGSAQWYDIEFDRGAALVSEPHLEGAWEHLTSLTGELTVTTGDAVFRVAEGATVRYPADRKHAIRNTGNGLARALLVNIYVNGIVQQTSAEKA